MATGFSDRLARLSANRFSDDRPLGDPTAGARMLADVMRAHGLQEARDIEHEDLEAIIAALVARETLSRGQLVDVAYAMNTSPSEGIPSVLEASSDAAFLELLRQATAASERPRRFRRVYGGLFSSYLARRPDTREAHERWVALRRWLSDGLADLPSDSDEVMVLRRHANLLSDDPCSRYAEEDSDDALVDELRNELRVPPNSWVFGEIMLARLRRLCARPDDEFRFEITDLLAQAEPYPAFLPNATGILLDRYAQATFAAEEHRQLRDLAVELWGNPFDVSTKPAWSAVSKPAKSLVENWVKRRVMDLFFKVIGRQYETDTRRSEFWSAFLDEIGDFHLFLGHDVYYSKASEHMELRDLMRGKFSRLDGDNANNGFLMFIGDTAYLEFSVTANACYVYDGRDLPVDLDARGVSTRRLKDQDLSLGRMTHQSAWEMSFRQRMRSEFGYRGSVGTRA